MQKPVPAHLPGTRESLRMQESTEVHKVVWLYLCRKQERIPALAPPTVPMAPSSEDPSTISIQALHVHHDQDSSAMAQDSSQSLVAASSIVSP